MSLPKTCSPPAEALPTCSSTEAALAALAKDKELAFATIEALSNEDIATKTASAPWDPRDLPLGFRFAQMVDHLKQHRAQLFYYLKLQGKPVNTWDFYGMEMPGA